MRLKKKQIKSETGNRHLKAENSDTIKEKADNIVYQKFLHDQS